MFARLPKQIFNKTVAENLAKCGALDCICGENRSKTLNDIHRIRKDKKIDILDENAYNRETCMQYEIETLGTSITYKSSWDNTPNNTDIKNTPVVIIDVKNYVAKSSGKSMGKLKVLYDGANVNAVIFPKVWSEMSDKPIADKNNTVYIDGKKDKDGNLVIKKIYKNQDNKNILMDPFSFVYDM